MAGVQRWFVGQLGGGSSTDGGWGEWPWSGGSHQTRDSEAQQAAPSHGGHGWNTWVALNVEPPEKREKNNIREFFEFEENYISITCCTNAHYGLIIARITNALQWGINGT